MTVHVVEYTDPGCPFAYSAEPHRQRLRWLYGDALEWSLRMVVLSRSEADYLEKGFTTERQAASLERIAAQHGMPIATHRRKRMHATEPACRAVVAARLHAPELEAPLLRRLRLRTFAGELLDEDDTIAAAALDVGLDPDALRAWMEESVTRDALEEDAAAARRPLPAALALDHKLASWTGGRRYTCPSYEITRSGRNETTIAVPGFQPFAVYEVTLANLRPDLRRRPAPDSAQEVLAWAGEPLATREVAAIMELSDDDARAALESAGARREPLGTDGLWTSAE